MPEKQTIQRARRAKRESKAPTTQAGEFVHEEIEHVRGGKHGARSTKQAIAIGLSKARRSRELAEKNSSGNVSKPGGGLLCPPPQRIQECATVAGSIISFNRLKSCSKRVPGSLPKISRNASPTLPAGGA